MTNEMSHRSYWVGGGVGVGDPTMPRVMTSVKRLSKRKMYAAISAEMTSTMSVRRRTVSRLGHVTLRSSDHASCANSTGLWRGALGALIAAVVIPVYPFLPARQERLELSTYGFGDRCSAS